MEKLCKFCKRVIIEDWEKWLKENPQAVWIQCPYFDCFEMERIR